MISVWPWVLVSFVPRTPPAVCRSLWASPRITVLNTEGKMHRITKETQYSKIHLSKFKSCALEGIPGGVVAGLGALNAVGPATN